MSIQENWDKFKSSVIGTEILLSLLILFVAVASFCLGRLSVVSDEQTFTPPEQSASVATSVRATSTKGTFEAETDSKELGYVASKNGTKYHLPWCGSASAIKEENKVWFRTKEEAERAGYSPASTCPGM